jgi:hypothetical protein
MNARKLLTVTAGVLMLAASSAFAHDGGTWRHGYSQRWHGHGYRYGHYRPRVVVVPRAPVYYAPPPVVYAPPRPVVVYPQPVVVAPARPTIVYRQPGFSLAVGF